uniref:Elongation of very long chain fatty acids protein n=1 Tax=Steinernema glaseri TaxID=37863 RepID=A0A1I7ZRE5_9BILA
MSLSALDSNGDPYLHFVTCCRTISNRRQFAILSWTGFAGGIHDLKLRRLKFAWTDFFHSLIREDLYRAICYSVHPKSVAAFWSLLFAISKLVELGDTLFIVLRKKPLIFLHYYHHAAVLIYTVHSGAEHTAPGRVFIVMNYFAHSVMYTYYAVTASGLKPRKWISMCVTSIQLGQMLAGVLVTFVVYKIKVDDNMSCQQSMGNLYLAFIIYLTFALLFLQFFVNNYFRKASKPKAATKKDE